MALQQSLMLFKNEFSVLSLVCYVIGSCEYSSHFQLGLKLLESGLSAPKPLVIIHCTDPPIKRKHFLKLPIRVRIFN